MGKLGLSTSKVSVFEYCVQRKKLRKDLNTQQINLIYESQNFWTSTTTLYNIYI